MVMVYPKDDFKVRDYYLIINTFGGYIMTKQGILKGEVSLYC